MVSRLLDFPTDVLFLVLKYLSTADLGAICLTHRGLRAFAEPVLYSKIKWIWVKDRTPPIISFLQSILRRPRLASFVKSVTLDGKTFEPSGRYRHESPRFKVTGNDLGEIVQCVRGLSVSFESQWIEQLRSGTMDAYIALLLSQLPNLKHLHLSENFTRETCFVGMVLRTALYEKHKCFPSFDQLRYVSTLHFDLGIDIRSYTDYRNTADVLPLFYLPLIEHIATLIDNPITFSWPSTHPPNPSRLTSLELMMIREGNLGQILSVTCNLKRLYFNWYYREDLEDQFVTDTIDLERIGADLLHVQETLEDLTIVAVSGMARGNAEFPALNIRGDFRIFRNLHSLKNLEVPLPLLLGFSPSGSDIHLAECLPKALEVLTITDYLSFQEEWEWEEDDILEALRFWLENSRGTTPHLQLLRLVFQFVSFHFPTGQELGELCARAGIQAEMVISD